METMIRFINYILILTLFTTMFSCKKLDYEDNITPFGEVHFDISKIAISDYLKVKYNGNTIDFHQGIAGRVRVPRGESRFEFYDNRNGKVLLEKTINIDTANVEKFTLFQPTVDDPIAILDPNGQDDEEAAPEGFMKIKIANYLKEFLPQEKINIVMNLRYQQGRRYIYIPVDTIRNVGRNIGEEEFNIVKRAEIEPPVTAEIYYLSFYDSNTNEQLMNVVNTPYFSSLGLGNHLPFNAKHVYTIYLSLFETGYSANSFLQKDDIYYSINPILLYNDL